MIEKTIKSNSNAHIKFKASWQTPDGEHSAIQHFTKFNVWRDIDLLPQPLIEDIMWHAIGPGKSHHFEAEELTSPWEEQHLVHLPEKNFIGRFRNGQPIIPHVGRFYPAGMVTGIDGVFHEDIRPVRLIDKSNKSMSLDYNHPLAKQNIELEAEIIDIRPPTDEHGGRCNEVIKELLDGPGMQLPYGKKHTEFLLKGAFERIDSSSDDLFYQTERRVHHLDSKARKQISDLYSQHISSGAKILDLMSSWESHLSEALSNIEVTGLGMNSSEMEANPQLSQFVIHNLNQTTSIPFESQSFDCVICTASIEYLTDPLVVFSEVKRVLKPGGKFIVTFSNRWFPTKAIMLWSDIHEFERIGLVMEYFRLTDWTKAINTFSCKGLPRPENDPYYEQTHLSDPIYGVWAQKQE